MDRPPTWLRDHRWAALAAGTALLCACLLTAELGPRLADAYVRFGRWRKQEAGKTGPAYGREDGGRLEARRQQLARQLDDLYLRLSRSDQISVVVQVLRQSADVAGLTLREVRPAEPVTFPQYEALPIDVVLYGTFHQVGRFVDSLERSGYVINVADLDLRRDPASTVGLRARLALRVITLKERPGGS